MWRHKETNEVYDAAAREQARNAARRHRTAQERERRSGQRHRAARVVADRQRNQHLLAGRCSQVMFKPGFSGVEPASVGTLYDGATRGHCNARLFGGEVMAVK